MSPRNKRLNNSIDWTFASNVSREFNLLNSFRFVCSFCFSWANGANECVSGGANPPCVWHMWTVWLYSISQSVYGLKMKTIGKSRNRSSTDRSDSEARFNVFFAGSCIHLHLLKRACLIAFLSQGKDGKWCTIKSSTLSSHILHSHVWFV